MVESLTLAYRPRSFSDMVGQRINAAVLQQMVATDSVPSGLLFSGPHGVGKTTAARILAAELNPDERAEVVSGSSLAVIEIDAASNGSVADVRSLIDKLRYSVGARKRVVIFDEAHSITREGFNALLKTLEEPPAGVVFVLVTTEPQKLPDTILSRLTEFEFRRVGAEDIHSYLQHIVNAENLNLAPDLVATVASSSKGSVRDAIKLLDFSVRAGVSSVEQFEELFGSRDASPYLMAALIGKGLGTVYSLLDTFLDAGGDPRTLTNDLCDLVADMFTIQGGGEPKTSGRDLEMRHKLSKAVTPDDLYAVAAMLWDLRTKIRLSDDHLSSLRLVLALVHRGLSVRKSANPRVTPDISRPVAVDSTKEERSLTLSEIQQS